MDIEHSKEKGRSFLKKNNTELFVGFFIILGFISIAYTAIGIGGIQIFGSPYYSLTASFASVAGLKEGATVEIAGVEIGKVKQISLENGAAKIRLTIDSKIKIESDSLASIRTKGLIGEKFVKVTLGADEGYLSDGDEISDTESSLEIEELIGKFLYNSDDDGKTKEK